MTNFKIKVKKLDYLYDNVLSGLAAIFILSLIIYFSLKPLVDIVNLNIWFNINSSILIIRAFLLRLYKKSAITQDNYFKFYILFFTLASSTALVLGLSAIFILPSEIEYQMILVLLLGGLTSGSAISLSSKIEIFYVYVLLIMLPFIFAFPSATHEAAQVLSVSMFAWLIILLVLAKKISKSINENITLAFENQDLVLQLKAKVIEADSANRAKSDFLSVMSHEIRTPLNAIMGFVQILKKGEENKQKFKYLDTIDKSSTLLTNVINDILDISKIESGKFNLVSEIFNPEEEFNSLYLLFEQNALEKGIYLINSISTEMPIALHGDILRIKQITSNLLSNAIKFTPRGKKVEFCVKYDKNTTLLSVKVIDEGIGISQENIKNISQAFVQADSSTAREYGGTGLGLSIATKLLHLFNSKLKIESVLKNGSVFSFEINLAFDEEKQEEKKDDSIEASFEGKKILVAEDNRTNQMLIALILDELGIDVSMANDGVEVEEIFKIDKFDLVLMDINMPKKNGQEAMKDIKKYEKAQGSIPTPVVALTANAVSGDRENYLDAGFDEYLAKPIDSSELLRVLTRFFN